MQKNVFRTQKHKFVGSRITAAGCNHNAKYQKHIANSSKLDTSIDKETEK